jgi:hypothetical protein
LLDGWEIAHFGTVTARSAVGDADQDGRTELVEEAFGTNPLVPDAAGGPVVTSEGGFLTLTLTKRPGVTYVGQSAAGPNLSAFSAGTTTVLQNNASIYKVRDSIPISTSAKRFIRVQVIAAP